MMKFRIGPALFLLVFLVQLTAAPMNAAAARDAPTARSEMPNVLLIVSDDQAWTDFGFMGHPVIETPNLDQLAAESALFTDGYVPTSLCRASLATLLTGRYASDHKICNNDPPEAIAREAMLPFLQNAPTIPRQLGEIGYRSLQTGKFWEGHFSNGGFTHGMTKKGRHGDTGLDIGRKTMQPIYDFIEASKDDPFFIWYAPMMPHQPHNPPKRLLEKYRSPDRHEKIAKYYAMCEWFDETCGELLTYLDKNGLRENTLVLFVVDNGWIQETGPVRTTRGDFAPKSKSSPYDGGLRTPVMLRWPEKIEPAVYRDLVSAVDIAPTILAACGTEAPEMTGMSLLDFVTKQEPLKRRSVYGEIFEHDAVDLEKPERSLTHRWLRNGDWKLIAPTKEPAGMELYNLAQDPHEEKNLADRQSERAQDLASELKAWSAM